MDLTEELFLEALGHLFLVGNLFPSFFELGLQGPNLLLPEDFDGFDASAKFLERLDGICQGAGPAVGFVTGGALMLT